MTEGVKVFLSEIGMTKYYDMFKIKGFDDESDIPYLTSFDLHETIMVTNQLDRTTILSHARLYRPRPEHAVYAWLSSNSLSYYFIGFIQSELTDLKKISQLSLPNEDLYDELEIMLPGHRKRLERAVQRLKLEQVNNASAEAPVSRGWWGKPECLPQAKFDFLCVKASLFSFQDKLNMATIEFMVDSGSDVSTVQEDTLKKLNLELIGPVYSCGIHGGNHTNLYKGRLKVGDQEMDIEVMGSNYDSLGSRVVRHFRHIIDGQQHIWLKGNYVDQLPAIVPIEFPVVAGISRLSQQSGKHQAPLPIAGVDERINEIAQERIELVVKTPTTDVDGVTSESLSVYLKSASAKQNSPQTKQPHNHIKSLTTDTVSNYSHSVSTCDEISKSRKLSNCASHSSTNNPQSTHFKYPHFRNKGKRSLKSNSHDLLKSSYNRKYLKTGLAKEPLHVSNERPQLSTVKSHVGENGSSDSVENFVGKPAQSDTSANSGESVSLCNTHPISLMDTDDDVDNLEGPMIISRANSVTERLETSEDSFINTDVVNLWSYAQNGSLDSRLSASYDHIVGPNSPDQGRCKDHIVGPNSPDQVRCKNHIVGPNSPDKGRCKDQIVDTKYYDHMRYTDQSIGTNYHDQGRCNDYIVNLSSPDHQKYNLKSHVVTSDAYDVVHVGGLHVDNMQYDDDKYNGNEISVESDIDEGKIVMNFIPASDGIKEIHLDETIMGGNYDNSLGESTQHSLENVS